MLTRADSDRRMRERAGAIVRAGGLEQALAKGLPKLVECTLSEALVLGLLKQGVSKYFAIFGHGSTDLGEVLRVYEEEGATRVINCRNEVEMAHAATALRWQYGELSAVVTSIGPGAMQAFAGSLAAASNGVGVYHVYGDETTFGEGYNMQQVPKEEQGLFGRMTAVMGQSYVLHTPEGLRDALRRGALCVNHPYRAGPFYLLLPLNTQPAKVTVNLAALPARPELPKLAPADDAAINQAAAAISKANKVVIKAGGGTRGHDAAITKLAEAAGATVVLSPGSTGVLPDAHAQNMHVGGSKGSISGNHAMAEAELLIVIGSRAVCQADCSGIGYKSVQAVININGDLADALHYNKTIALIGDIGAVAARLAAKLEASGASKNKRAWLDACGAKRRNGPPTSANVLNVRRCTTKSGKSLCSRNLPQSRSWLILPSRSVPPSSSMLVMYKRMASRLWKTIAPATLLPNRALRTWALRQALCLHQRWRKNRATALPYPATVHS